MTPDVFLLLGLFLLAGALAVFLTGRGADAERLNARLRDLSPRRGDRIGASRAVLAVAPGKAPAALPGGEAEGRTRLRTRLLHAGLYGPHAARAFLTVKAVLMLAPWLAGLAVGWAGWAPLIYAVAGGALAGAAGMIAPGFWLDARKKRRQNVLRNGLPDVLDVLVLCLEGGLSLPAAFQRVVGELRGDFPLLGLELTIVQREAQLGQTLSQALRRFGDRADLEEVTALAAVLDQTERFGAGLVKTLRTHAEQLRFRRLQQNEERAQKAGALILFPTLLFIFPGVFVILLGPAAYQVRDVMAQRRSQPLLAAPQPRDTFTAVPVGVRRP